jgi:glycosyltransferase involved in cell wall biosynthesis
MKIVYVLGAFPALTTTFIDREILETQRRGVDLVLVSMYKLAPFQTSAEISKLAAHTKYLLPAPWLRFLKAHLRFAVIQPRAYLGTLVHLLTRQHSSIGAWFRTLFYFLLGVRAAELLRQEPVDHIHAHFAGRTTVVAMVVSRLLGVPYSLTAHAYDIYASPVMLSEKMTGARFVATCTGYNKAHLERIDGGRFASKVHLIYHGLDLSKFEQNGRPSRDGQRPVLLSVGQLKEKKGFPYLINACRLLKDRGYEFRCEIVGEGPKRSELEALIAELDLHDTVVLRGALPHSEVLAMYAQATLFSLACVLAEDGDRDGIPNVLLEAMAMQVPVVSTRFSGIPEAVEEGRTGLLVQPGDVEALANALARLLDDPDLRERCGREGRRLVEERFDVRDNIGRLIKLFEEQDVR